VGLLLLLTVAPSALSGSSGQVSRMVLHGSVNPGSATFFSRVLAEANRDGDQLLLVELDTPGGLVSSLRSMVRDVLASNVPVVVYVSPSGAQAASAGALLLLSSHVAAMAPGTETGAAHPVGMGGGEEEKDGVMSVKAANDLAAFARSLAEERGRNAEWAEKAVRESIASPASEALKSGVIDTIAASRGELLAFLEGRKVKTVSGIRILKTAGIPIREQEPSFRERVMMSIADPNIAYLLLLLGLAGLYFELASPGAIFPGVAGAVSLLLALFAMQLLSADTTGLLLVLAGLVFLGLELFVTSGGVLAVAGLVALFFGSLMVFSTPETGLSVSWWFFLPFFLAFAAVVMVLVRIVARASRRGHLSGSEALVGQTGRVFRGLEPGRPGKVFVHGELWDAVGTEPAGPGRAVTVTGIDGMQLNVQLKKE
jgi:membrane-bound serine protease (ClpP class)